MIRKLADDTGRTRQSIVDDALDYGLCLVTLHELDPDAARAILSQLQRKLFRNYPVRSNA